MRTQTAPRVAPNIRQSPIISFSGRVISYDNRPVPANNFSYHHSAYGPVIRGQSSGNRRIFGIPYAGHASFYVPQANGYWEPFDLKTNATFLSPEPDTWNDWSARDDHALGSEHWRADQQLSPHAPNKVEKSKVLRTEAVGFKGELSSRRSTLSVCTYEGEVGYSLKRGPMKLLGKEYSLDKYHAPIHGSFAYLGQETRPLERPTLLTGTFKGALFYPYNNDPNPAVHNILQLEFVHNQPGQAALTFEGRVAYNPLSKASQYEHAVARQNLVGHVVNSVLGAHGMGAFAKFTGSAFKAFKYAAPVITAAVAYGALKKAAQAYKQDGSRFGQYTKRAASDGIIDVADAAVNPLPDFGYAASHLKLLARNAVGAA